MGLKFRRGTTAQKSGSLAFGEPYVNTDLNTLQIGGASGDIILAAAGTSSVFVGQSVSASSWVSASSLRITGNAQVDGNLTLGGQLTIGDATSDTVNVVASLSSSLIPSETNAFDLGSETKIWRDLYISTGSIKFVNPGTGTVVGTLSSNAGGDFRVAGEISGSTINGLGNATLYSTSVDSRIVTNVNSAAGAFASASAYSASAAVVAITNANSAAGAFASASAYSGSAAVVAITNANSAAGAFASASAYSGSAATALNNASSSAFSTFAKLSGDNTFSGTQTITGSLFVSQNLVVQGSSSLQNITASAVSIGTNTVILNTNSPAVRWGGIQVIDSGSSSATSSLFWDSLNDVWVYVNPTGSSYTSARLLSGPKSLTLGSETALTNTNVPKIDDGDHLVDSQITDDGTTVKVVNAISASTFTGLGNLTTYSSSVASRVNTLETAGYAVSSSVASATATSISTLSGSVKTVTDALSGRVTTLEGKDISVTLTGDVTGTGTITDLGNVSFATTIAANSVALGTDTTGDYVATMTAGAGITVGTATGEGSTPVITNTGVTSNVAGTGISVSGATGAVTITNTGVTSAIAGTGVSVSGATGAITWSIGQAVATNSAVTFASVAASGDIVAFSSSDRKFKNNIQLIPNALEKVSKLNGVTWEWNDDVNDVTKSSPKTGLIAQEVQEVLPEVVSEREDGYLGLDYSKMVGLLVEAIKEQQTQIHSLTIEIENLKKNNSL